MVKVSWIRAAWWSGSLWLRAHKSSLRHELGGASPLRLRPCGERILVALSSRRLSLAPLFPFALPCGAASRAARRRDEEALPRRTSLMLRPSNCYCTHTHSFLSLSLSLSPRDEQRSFPGAALARGRGSTSLFRCASRASRPSRICRLQMRR